MAREFNITYNGWAPYKSNDELSEEIAGLNAGTIASVEAELQFITGNMPANAVGTDAVSLVLPSGYYPRIYRVVELEVSATAAQLEEALESFSTRQVARLATELKPLARCVYGAVHLLGCTFARKRGYHRNAGQVSFFCPAEALCAYLGISRGSFYRSLKELVALGLVDARGHKTTINGWAVRCDGTLWSVKLFPRQGGRAKLRREDLKARYRDLEADIEAGNTVYQQMRQSKTSKAKPVEFESLVRWALTLYLNENPVTLTVASEGRLELEILLDVLHLPKRGRRDGVDRAARALCQHLGDASSLNFYRYLVWQLLRLDQQGRGYFDVLYTMVMRVKADMREGFARKPGALLVSRLKTCTLWSEIREMPLVRVAA